MIKKITFSMWLISLIIWNYAFPGAAPWEDVFAGVCLYFSKRAVEKYMCE